MKNIIFLVMSVLFSSVQATNFNQAEGTCMATALAQDTEFVASVHALCQQGLAPAQIVALLVQSDEMLAYAKNTHWQRAQRKERREMLANFIVMAAAVTTVLLWGSFTLHKYFSEQNNTTVADS